MGAGVALQEQRQQVWPLKSPSVWVPWSTLSHRFPGSAFLQLSDLGPSLPPSKPRFPYPQCPRAGACPWAIPKDNTSLKRSVLGAREEAQGQCDHRSHGRDMVNSRARVGRKG